MAGIELKPMLVKHGTSCLCLLLVFPEKRGKKCAKGKGKKNLLEETIFEVLSYSAAVDNCRMTLNLALVFLPLSKRYLILL
jgi:hypothetical protein